MYLKSAKRKKISKREGCHSGDKGCDMRWKGIGYKVVNIFYPQKVLSRVSNRKKVRLYR